MTIEYILRVTKKLNSYNIKYVITGGVAQFIRGEKKTTLDLDLLIFKSEKNFENIELFISDFGKLTLNVKEILSANKIIRLKIFPFWVDILPRLDGLNGEDVFSNSEIMNYYGILIPLISKNNLTTNYNYLKNETNTFN